MQDFQYYWSMAGSCPPQLVQLKMIAMLLASYDENFLDCGYHSVFSDPDATLLDTIAPYE